MPRFHPAFSEPSSTDGGGTCGGTKGIGRGSRAFVEVARRDGVARGVEQRRRCGSAPIQCEVEAGCRAHASDEACDGGARRRVGGAFSTRRGDAFVGEADNPGPASRRRRTQRLRALRRAMESDTESEDDHRNVAQRVESQVTVLDSDDDEAPLLGGSRPPSVELDGPAHESSRPGEVSDVSPQVESISSKVCLEVAAEFPRLEAQEDFSQVENTQPVRLGRRLVLVPQSTGTPRSVQDRQEFTATVADEPTPRGKVLPSGRTPTAPWRQQNSDDGRPVSEVDEEFGPHEEMLVEEEVALVRQSVAGMRAGFAQLESWDLRDLFRQRGCLLKSVPRFLWGSFRVALEESLARARVPQHNGEAGGKGVEGDPSGRVVSGTPCIGRR